MSDCFVYPISLLSLLICLLSGPLAAQQEPLKWGKVLETDLQMKQYARDTSAKAVILADVGFISMRLVDGLQYAFRHHRRIKILDAEGFKEGDIRIPYYSNNNLEKISQLKAHIIYPDGSRQSLSKRQITDELIDEHWTQKRLQFADLQVGSVIEYRYEIVSERIQTLHDWYFQSHLPVRYSELVVEIPEYFDYAYLLQTNDKPIHIESSTHTVSMETDIRNTPENDSKVHITSNRYVMKNVSALKAAPYITTMNDYRARLRFYLSKVTHPSGREERILPSWVELAGQLHDSPDFGTQLPADQLGVLYKAAASILNKKNQSQRKKLSKLYHFINQSMAWDSTYTALGNTDFAQAWESRKASSGALNLMLLALLKKANITAYPLLISTRSHGKIVHQYPAIDQFNHCLIYAIADGDTLTLDAGDELRPPGLLRTEALNGYGFLLNPSDPRWTSVKARRNTENYLAYCTLGQQGQLRGRLEGHFDGTSAAQLRRQYLQDTDQQFWQSLLAPLGTAVSIDSSEALGIHDREAKLETHIQFHIMDAAERKQGKLLLRPVLLSQFSQSVLKTAERKFAVDIPYPVKEQFVMLLQIPDSYVVEYLPEALRVLIYDDGGDFNYLLSQDGNQIKLISRINIRKLYYNSEDYDDIKEFFEQIEAKFAEPIILKKLEE